MSSLCRCSCSHSVKHKKSTWQRSRPSQSPHPPILQCTNKKAWKDIAAQLGIGPSSSGAYTLKKHYGKNLLPFECHFERGGVDPAPILAQVDPSLFWPSFDLIHTVDVNPCCRRWRRRARRRGRAPGRGRSVQAVRCATDILNNGNKHSDNTLLACIFKYIHF